MRTPNVPASATTVQLMEAMRLDKKARDAELRFALPARIGAMHRDGRTGHTIAASEDAVLAALQTAQ